jgi:hypothetical protein
MANTRRSFETDIAAAEARLASDRFAAVEALVGLHESAARAALDLSEQGSLARQVHGAAARGISTDAARRAEAHLAHAERYQWQIGTWATGSGEGLASMSAVRELQLARAWLLTVLPDADAHARSSALLAELDGDPNDSAARLAPERDALRASLRVASPLR